MILSRVFCLFNCPYLLLIIKFLCPPKDNTVYFVLSYHTLKWVVYNFSTITKPLCDLLWPFELLDICLAVGWQSIGERVSKAWKSWVRFHWLSICPPCTRLHWCTFSKRKVVGKVYSVRFHAACWSRQIWPSLFRSSLSFGKGRTYPDY